jgi:hypothetical protein
MNKRAIKRIIVAISLIALVVFAYGFFQSQKSSIEYLYHYIFISDSEPIPNPNLLRYYPENKTGYYQFDPRTILASLEQGKDVFTPSLIKDPNDVDDYYPNIAWTQSDFLGVASALSQQVWNEPLDLDGWGVYHILLSGGCSDHFDGFDDFGLTYYKTIKTGWETVYIGRRISLIPATGVAEWAGDGNFSAPSVFGWQKIELTKFKTTAEQAVRIAEENGGKAARLNSKNKCSIYVDIDENVNRNTKGGWLVHYSNMATPFSVFINPFTGRLSQRNRRTKPVSQPGPSLNMCALPTALRSSCSAFPRPGKRYLLAKPARYRVGPR